jgi:putative chitinase
MDKAAFYITVKAKLGSITASQVGGFEEVLAATEGQPLSHRAYSLATAWHETAKTMLPVREAYWVSEAWRKANLRYWPHYGRGYVQLTWDYNYAKADKELKLGGTLIKNLDRAMEPKIAAQIMRLGMDEGWFTGVSLKKVLPLSGTATKAQYIAARKIINGTDKADLIEDYAQAFERALRDAGVK